MTERWWDQDHFNKKKYQNLTLLSRAMAYDEYYYVNGHT